jgi:hypothetical protein
LLDLDGDIVMAPAGGSRPAATSDLLVRLLLPTGGLSEPGLEKWPTNLTISGA